MDTLESVLWLKKVGLFNRCVVHAQKLKVIFNECLKIEDEDVLVIGDTGIADRQVAPIFAGACFLAARALNHNAKLVLQHGNTPPSEEEVRKALEMTRPGSALVVSLSGKMGSVSKVGKPFKRLCQEKRFRYTSTPSLGTLRTSMIATLVDSVSLDYNAMRQLHSSVKKVIDEGSVMHINTAAGTDLSIGIKGINAISSDGLFTTPGFGGNLPAGEVFLAPVKNKVDGTVVIDCSSRNKETTLLIKEPIILIIKNGEVVEIKGGKEAQALKASIKHGELSGKNNWGHKMIGEVGIGLNPNAKICGSMIIDEKVRGTAHVAIGSNHWFGGTVYASIHLDQVFKDPHITIDGRQLTF